ncbi:MAG: response regulator [Calditrichaeota bacterium]|nr:response regulator [Calditrichota bacterium]
MARILIVDDSATARALIRRSLDICGLKDVSFLEAGNGKEALKILKDEKVDFVFTDINMPEMDGEALLKRIKSSPKLFHLPVVVITSLKNSIAEQNLIREHAAAVLAKPLELPEVHKILRDSLNLI